MSLRSLKTRKLLNTIHTEYEEDFRCHYGLGRYGRGLWSFAPLNAFLKVFSEEKGIDITYRQAREPMGLLKIDHINDLEYAGGEREVPCLV